MKKKLIVTLFTALTCVTTTFSLSKNFNTTLAMEQAPLPIERNFIQTPVPMKQQADNLENYAKNISTLNYMLEQILKDNTILTENYKTKISSVYIECIKDNLKQYNETFTNLKNNLVKKDYSDTYDDATKKINNGLTEITKLIESSILINNSKAIEISNYLRKEIEQLTSIAKNILNELEQKKEQNIPKNNNNINNINNYNNNNINNLNDYEDSAIRQLKKIQKLKRESIAPLPEVQIEDYKNLLDTLNKLKMEYFSYIFYITDNIKYGAFDGPHELDNNLIDILNTKLYDIKNKLKDLKKEDKENKKYSELEELNAYFSENTKDLLIKIRNKDENGKKHFQFFNDNIQLCIKIINEIINEKYNKIQFKELDHNYEKFVDRILFDLNELMESIFEINNMVHIEKFKNNFQNKHKEILLNLSNILKIYDELYEKIKDNPDVPKERKDILKKFIDSDAPKIKEVITGKDNHIKSLLNILKIDESQFQHLYAMKIRTHVYPVLNSIKQFLSRDYQI